MVGERLAQSIASYLADLFAEFVSKIALLGPLVLGAGCEGKSDAKVSANQAAKVVEAAQPPAEAPAKDTGPIGEFDITFYYVTSEEEIEAKIARRAAKAANDNAGEALAVAAERELVPLYDKSCSVLAEVDAELAKAIALQGTGRLKDGRLLNAGGGNNCDCPRRPCVQVIEGQTWGTTGTGRSLQPFRTVAVDPQLIKLGSLLYIPLLEGRTMPGRAPWGGFVHDGCVAADDTGGGIKGKQLDLFVGRKGYFLGLSGSGGSHAWARHVEVFDGASHCERKGRRIARKSATP